MCFSAQASLTSGAVLSAIGVITLRQTWKPEQKLFASIPLLFGIQQFAEGILWITLKSGRYAHLENVAAHIFLVAALVVWPVMIPTSIWLMEREKRKKKILAVLMGLGGVLSLFYAFCLLFFNVTPQVQSFHIVYIDSFPIFFAGIAFLFYVATTVIPLFVSSVKRMWLFGILISVSLVVTGIFFQEYLTSVWCFFAAGLSITIYWVLDESRSRADELTSEFQR